MRVSRIPIRNLRRVALFALGAVLSFSPPARAKIDLVTLPPRDSSELTIYNQEDLTLVRERRTTTFAEGLNRIQFSWAGTLIDPTSLEIAFPGSDSGAFTVRDVSYPANTENLLIWNIEARASGPADIEISCFTSGLSWSADYVLTADPAEENLRMEGWVRVYNNSGEDYVNASTRLLVGEINLVEKIAELARRGIAGRELEEAEKQELRRAVAEAPMATTVELGADMGSLRRTAPKEIQKQGVSEYFLYSIEGRETIQNRWSKRLPSFQAQDVPFEVSYEYNDRKYGDQVVLFYKFKNDEEHELGAEPLPDGRYAVYRENDGGGLAFVNSTSLKYVPVGEDVELNLGNDGLVTLEKKLMDFERLNPEFNPATGAGDEGVLTGWDERRAWRFEFRNSRNRSVELKAVEHPTGDWSIETSEDYRKVASDEIEFERTIPALGTLAIEFDLVTRHGSRANRETR